MSRLYIAPVKKPVSLVVICYIFCLYTSCSVPRYPTTPLVLSIQPSDKLLTRGKALVAMMCADCHRDPQSGQLSGKHMADVPKIMGRLYSKNITRHPQQGIGSYTEGELAYLLRSGIDRKGHLSPLMSKPGIADEDLQAIIAYLKHAPDKEVQPAAVESGTSRYSMPAKLAFRFVLKPYEYPQQPIAVPDLTQKEAYGKYLVRMLACYECHSRNMTSVDKWEPEKSKGYMAGGARLKGLDGKSIRVPNITMDQETGIGKWTELEFIQAIRESSAPGHRIITYPMPNYGALSEQEAAAIYAYIQTIPAVGNKIRRKEVQLAAGKQLPGDTLSAGRQLYVSHGCQACHGKEGIGIADLRKASLAYPDDSQLKAFIKNPDAFRPGARMPAFHGIIAEEEYKPLISYVRWLGKDQKLNHK